MALVVDNNFPKVKGCSNEGFFSDQQSSTFQSSQPSLSISEVIVEIKLLYAIVFPMIITGLLVYGKSLISMLFMGRLGKEALAGGSLAIGIANITSYSVISGLSMGMEPISSQAFGAKQLTLMVQALQRTIIILLFYCIPISFLWLNIQPILLFCGQDPAISSIASTYLCYCLPDLLFQSLINPLRIHLRSQNITFPLMFSAAVALTLHAPINYFLIYHLSLGIKGTALAVAITDFNILATLTLYIFLSGICRKSWHVLSVECFNEWKPILSLALPSCVYVCLEWWWYELMILLSGVLTTAPEAVAAMGILLQATSLVYIFPSALSLAVSTRVGNVWHTHFSFSILSNIAQSSLTNLRVGNELGANQPSKARTSSLVAMFCAILTSVIAISFIAMTTNMWARAFTLDRAIMSLTATVMPVVGLCELGNCPQTTGCGVLRGSARPSLAANIYLGSFYGVGLPVAIFMGFGMKMGLVGLWLGLLSAQTLCALLVFSVLMRTNWAAQSSKARKLTGVEVNQENEEEQNGRLMPIKQ